MRNEENLAMYKEHKEFLDNMSMREFLLERE